MRLLLSGLLLISSVSVASGLPTRGVLAPVFTAQASSPPIAPASPAANDAPSTGDEEEDDDDDGDDEEAAAPAPPEPSAQPGPAPAQAPGAPSIERGTTAPALPISARTLTPEQSARQQELVSGAPLYNPNVAVHIVEKKQFSDAGKSELAIYPLAAQVNGKFVQHYGSALSYTYHVNENFGLQLTPQFNWSNKEAAFNEEFVQTVQRLPVAASSLLLKWGATAGVEVSPFYGKFAFYQGSLAHFSFVINGGAGVGDTRVQIRGPLEENGALIPAAYGDTGLRFLGSVGAGFRLQIGNRFAFRLEARDLVYSAQVSSVDGCNEADLQQLENFSRSNPDRSFTEAGVRGGCDVSKFEGVLDGYDLERHLPLARDRVEEPSSDVLNNIGFYTGFSFLF